MEDNVIFKTSVFGFDKKEVIEFLTLMCERNAETIDSVNKLQAELEGCKQENEKLRADNEKLFDDNRALKKSEDDLKNTIDALNAKVNELEERTAAFDEIEGAEEKANQLMMDSLRYSESCIKKAREVTASINLSTKTKIDKAKSCLNGVSDDFKNLTGKLQDSISEISEKLADLSSGLEE